MRKFNLLKWSIFFFFTIGLVVKFLADPISILVPILIIGLIFYFIKYPEKLNWRRNYNYRSSYKVKKHRKKDNPFKVIDGDFKEIDEDKRYH